MPEAILFDHYEVLTRDDGSAHELGRGAMGITYKAFDTSLRITVALKVINATYLNSEVARQRFVREARSAAKLRHRHVASVFHLGTEGETWFYAMEFIDGETVEAVIKREGPLPPAMALTITAQVARALNAATQHGLVHRDIKPANLMLVREDDELVAKVIDFGLAKTSVAGDPEDAATLSMGGFVGTPHFASPEQHEEREIDVRSDIYSLGVTLWYMLAGQAPFAGSMAQVMSQHLSKPPPFEKLEALPPAAAEVLRRMLEKDPADRFQTPAELRKAIEDALADNAAAPAAAAAAPAEDEENFATLLETSAERPGETRFEVGVVLAGRYRILEVLGETNTGRAFRAFDGERQGDVRILVLHPEFLGDAAACTGLEREVEKLKPVQHPNLLGVHDFETIEQVSFLALEWTNGFTLLELLRARRELEADETLALLSQAASGVDHALALGLGGLEFGLHQLFVHFSQPVEKAALLRAPVAQWRDFVLKIYPLAFTRDLASSQTWAGGQTMVGGGAGTKPEGADARPRYIQALAAVGYELLGGTVSAVAGGAAGARYTPLSTLSEEGNEVLRRALDPARSFASAEEFCAALRKLDGLQVRQPVASAASAAPPLPAHALPPPLPPAKKKSPLGLFVGIAAGVIVLGGGAYFLIPRPAPPPDPTHEETPPPDTEPVVKRDPEQEEKERQARLEKERQEAMEAEKKKEEEAKAAEEKKMQAAEEKKALAAKQRQELLKTRIADAQALEEKGEWAPSVRAWLAVAREFPESGVGKNHLETLLNHLRDRPSPITSAEFAAMRTEITEAAQIDILSAMMLIGDNVRWTEPETALKWYTAASEKGDPVAFTQLGFLMETGVGDAKPDFVKAVKYFQTAADKGDVGGKFALGRCYLTGRGLPEKDEKRGAELAREAADAGDTRAMNLLGDCYTHGTGVNKDFAEAFRLFTRAADRGNLKALGNLGVLCMTGRGVPAANPKKAAELFEKGARAGDAACMFNYAQCLEEGIGTARNSLQAQAWYRKAAEAGDTRAAEWCRKRNIPFTRQ
jgi:serine/threonine protein kinase/TPR repeat protein